MTIIEWILLPFWIALEIVMENPIISTAAIMGVIWLCGGFT